MVVIGGITRLTESGLSITHGSRQRRRPAAQPRRLGARVRAVPGRRRNIARSPGRPDDARAASSSSSSGNGSTGCSAGSSAPVFFVGLVWFAVRRAIPRGFGWRLVALFVLGGLQGAIGWFMVLSGLEGSGTEVSPYRLSAHLLMALFLFSALIWTALDLRRLAATPPRVRRGSPAGARSRSPCCSSSCCSAPGSRVSAPAMSRTAGPT